MNSLLQKSDRHLILSVNKEEVKYSKWFDNMKQEAIGIKFDLKFNFKDKLDGTRVVFLVVFFPMNSLYYSDDKFSNILFMLHRYEIMKFYSFIIAPQMLIAMFN